MTTDHTPTPAVRQIWQDNDPRSPNRYLKITAVDGTHATMRQVAITPQGATAVPSGARATRIRLDRLRPTSTGYRYIRTDPA
ncbi:hypothetical protein TU94_28225 [Streptomyces cyaneogriseus subsp. noncyanogenus]|uniref:Uncharacterized protein n=1 Tax=Streptomyces cyaneogriseus subsp. noncyanogenus TaxID=477245 RepID=A0A0C5G8T0_9ACTN|nr:hypothetical protein [Streptomyces cyaneogriseus]AJP04754.1 hypothetical protein TU94_28225 [Streptomyces cyaneogriseus subsp. noncyanogenus]